MVAFFMVVTNSRTSPPEAASATIAEPEITPDAPASILQTHPNATIYLDEAAAAKLRQRG